MSRAEDARKTPTVPMERVKMLLAGEPRPTPFPDELVPDLSLAQLGCPLCGKVDTLYQDVSVAAWISVVGVELAADADPPTVQPKTSTGSGGTSREVDWHDYDHEGYACSNCCTSGEHLAELALVVPPKAVGTASS